MVWPAVIAAAAVVGGSLLSSNANSRASKSAANAARDSAQIQADAQLESTRLQIEASERSQQTMREAAARGIGAIQAGTNKFVQTMTPLTERRSEFYNPNFQLGLTPNQTIAREDLQRQGRATIAKSGLRGAGRAGAAAILDADRKFLAAAAADNDTLNRNAELKNIDLREQAQNKRDAAVSDIARIYAQEGSAVANTEIGQGNRMADNQSELGRAIAANAEATGRAQGRAAELSGMYSANANMANAKLWSDAIGKLGAVAAKEV